MSLRRLSKSSMKTVCKGVFKLNFILYNLPLFLRRFLMHMMPKKKSMLLLVCLKKTNVILNKTNSTITQIASTTIACIILNHTTLHALTISHYPAISMHLITHLPHAQISIHTAHNTYELPSFAIHHHKMLTQTHHVHLISLASSTTTVIVRGT